MNEQQAVLSPWKSRKEISAYFGIAEADLNRQNFPYYKTGKNTVLYNLPECEEFVKSKRVQKF